MNSIKPERYETRRAMMLAGLKQQHSFAKSFESIPKQWQAFLLLGQIKGQIGTTVYGVGCGSTSNGFEYMTGVEVDSFAVLPAKIGRMRIAEQYYAVFLHRDHIATIQNTWKLILNEWLPKSGARACEVPNFEIYDERFNLKTGSGEVEIYIAIEH